MPAHAQCHRELERLPAPLTPSERRKIYDTTQPGRSHAGHTFGDHFTEPERAALLADYTARIAKAYPPTVDGKVLLRFPRLFIVAMRA